MKAIIEKEEYEKGLKHIIYKLNIEVMLIGFVAVFIYKYFKIVSGQSDEVIGSAIFLSDLFFKGVIVWAVFYFLKKLYLTRQIDKAYDNVGVEDDYYYLPCVYLKNMFSLQTGTLLYDEEKEYLFFNGANLKADDTKILKSRVMITSEEGNMKVLLNIFWGETKVLILKDVSNNKSYTYLVPDPDTAVVAINKVLRKE